MLMSSKLMHLSVRWELFLQRVLLTISIALAWNVSTGLKIQNELENIEIIVERTPYSLVFSLNNTEKYALQHVDCSDINVVGKMENEAIKCDQLFPCTTYRAILSIQDLKTKEIFTRDCINKTEYADPTVTHFKVEPTTTTILLSWEVTDSTCISNYTIQVKSPGNNIEKTANNKQHDFLIEDLSPCVEHFIEMRAYDINDKMVSNLTTTSTTERAEPGNITNITIDIELEGGHAKVSWNHPSNKTCIDFYFLKWFPMNCGLLEQKYKSNGSREISQLQLFNGSQEECEIFAEIHDPNLTEYLIKGLDGCENYGFQIFINNKTNAKSEVKEFTSAHAIPDEVTIELPEVEIDKVFLRWNSPKKNCKCVKRYDVRVEGPMQREDQRIYNSVSENTYTVFDDLEPCGKYSVSVTPLLLNGTKGIVAQSDFETLEAKPSAVRNIVINAEPYSLNIYWEEPVYAVLCINEYHVAVWANTKSPGETYDDKINVTRSKITGLIACQSYTVQIIATTKNSEDGELIQIETETAATIAQPPENFQYTDRYSDGLELSTRSNNVNNTCDIIFARFVCTPKSSDANAPEKSAEGNVEGKVAGTSFKFLVTPLSPYTEYKCSASFFNIAGWSKDKQIVASTLAYFSGISRDISLRSVSQSTVAVQWDPPLHPNGVISLYKGHFQRVRAEYYIPPNCPPAASNVIDLISTSCDMQFTDLQPYVRYSIQVAAENDYGVGEYTRPFIAVTNPSISEPVKDLKVAPYGPYESEEIYQAYVLVSWAVPCKSNGKIQSFELEFRGERGAENDHFHRTVKPNFSDNGRVIYNETNLQPDFNYEVSVTVRNVDVKQLSASKRDSFDSPAGIPKRFNEATMRLARVSAFESRDPTRSAVVRFPANILESDTGSVIYAALLVSQKKCNTEPTLIFGALNTRDEWPESSNWNQAYFGEENGCVVQYQTTEERWQPQPKVGSNEVEFTVGTEKCNDSDDRYCNGPLLPDTEFYLVIRLFTRSGYNDAAVLEFRTDSLVQLKVILISVSCCLLFAFIAGFVYIYITKRMLWKRQSYHDIEDPFGDIMTKNFAKYYYEISRPEKLAREFRELTMVAMDFSYTASEMGRNKNRYVDVYPYDKNRVILDIDADGSDYINASFINGYRRKKEFIATQGPKPESTLDFWRMVLQHNIRVIVMVTQFREGDKIKCHEYFPYKSMGINVAVKKKDTFDLYDRSEMTVTHERHGLRQKVVHFYFKKWPDYGCPDDPMHLITFVRKVKAEKVPSYSSIVVHCSAGVGRTGTFIGLDTIMQRIKSESKINVYGTVKKLRFQRMKMVQSIEQYTFLYKCAYELVKHKNQRAFKSQGEKKNGSQENHESSSSTSSTNVTTPVRPISKPVPSDLSSIEENVLECSENVNSKQHSSRAIPQIKLTPTSSPSTSNSLIKPSDLGFSESTM